MKQVIDLFKGSNRLIIPDDCASGQEIKNRMSKIVKFWVQRRRHYGLSTIVITQQLTKVRKPYRENISRLVTFYTANRSDMKTITDDYLNGVDKGEINHIAKLLKENMYAYLEETLRHPYCHRMVY